MGETDQNAAWTAQASRGSIPLGANLADILNESQNYGQNCQADAQTGFLSQQTQPRSPIGTTSQRVRRK
jgi:hypothetical protein